MEILRLFKEAGWSGIVYPDTRSADRAKSDPYTLVLCPYKGENRNVHPEVCKWHREEQDSECLRQGCRYADWQEDKTPVVEQRSFLE